jgi:antitoxin component YwqK of YwqJK toxin-antitoxin module
MILLEKTDIDKIDDQHYRSMRVKNVFILLILFVPVACKIARKRIVGRFPNGKVALIYYYPNKNDTLTFNSIEYYSSGQIHRRDSIQNGRVIGNSTIFYPNGKIYEIDSITNLPEIYGNRWDGKMTRYYENGNISEQFIIRKGIVDGLTRHYDESGILIKEYSLKDTTKNGEYKEFYKNGQLSFETTYLKGVPVGFEYFFGEKGDTIKYYAINHMGEISLPYKRWLANGEVLTGNFIDTSQNSAIWIWLTKDGKEFKRKVEHSDMKTFVSPEPN